MFVFIIDNPLYPDIIQELKLLLTHPGTQYAPLLAAQLDRKKILYRFVTGIAVSNNPNRVFWKIMHLFGKDKLASKRSVSLPRHKLYRLPLMEAEALIRVARKEEQDAVFFDRNKKFQQRIPWRLIKNSDVIVGFDTCSWILAKRCKQSCKPYIMDASIAHPLAKEKIFADIRDRFPAWQNEIKPKAGDNIEVELQEMQLADHIVVATQFTKKTYVQNGVSPLKISINPYGTNLEFFASKWPSSASAGHSLVKQKASQPVVTYLFFGSISARKGFPWLCAIWEGFHAEYPHTQLIAAGHGKPPDRFVLPKGIKLIGAIHPNDRTQLFHSADVFVFPSFFEGFAQVIIEAMACGLPVITTTHTVGPEVIDGGVEGFVINPGEDEELYRAMAFFAENTDKIEGMGRAARERVLPLTWDAYGDRWEEIAKKVLQSFAN